MRRNSVSVDLCSRAQVKLGRVRQIYNQRVFKVDPFALSRLGFVPLHRNRLRRRAVCCVLLVLQTASDARQSAQSR